MQDLLGDFAAGEECLGSFLRLLKDAPSRPVCIQNASHDLSIARKEMEQTHSRLNLYLSRGILLADRHKAGEE